MNYIYELIDPETNKIRYVGITNNPKVRYWHHLENLTGGPEKILWVKDLVSRGLKPTFAIREEIEDREEVLLKERYWILRYLDEGKALVNVVHGISPAYKAPPTIPVAYVLSAYRERTYNSMERHYKVRNNLLAQELAFIERKDSYSLDDLFLNLPMTPAQLAEVLDIPERTIDNFKNGLQTSSERIKLLLRFFTWIFQTKFSLINVTGIKIQESTDNLVVANLLNGEI